MNVLIVGSDGFIGAQLFRRLSERAYMKVFGTSRRGNGIHLDLLCPEVTRFPSNLDVLYLCAAMTRFIECEADPISYNVNVDAQIEIAKRHSYAKIVYLSSEAVEKALHTNYGMQKALCEMGLRTVCDPIIVRLSKVTPTNVDRATEFLESMANCHPGVYHWPGDDAHMQLKAVA